MKMMKQQFALNDHTKPELFVVKQRSLKYEALSIQISAVINLERDPIDFDEDQVTLPLRYIYEEISNDSDIVMYARYMSVDNIRDNYSWFFDALNIASTREV
jgi:hypothetical protein